MKKIIIDKYSYNQRVDKYILKYLNNSTKSFIYKMFRKKRIKLNGKKITGNEILKIDDELHFYIAKETIANFQKSEELNTFSIPLDIIFEDDNIVIVNKPVGLLSHSASKNDENLNDAIVNYLIETNQYNHTTDKTFKPAICNRLDRNTSGIVVACKNLLCTQFINSAFKNHDIEKYYLTIVKGNLDLDDFVTNYLVKDEKNNKVTLFESEVLNGKKIISHIKTLKMNGDFSLLSVKLITGKSHQIRSQLKFLGYPIIGDTKYGDKKTNSEFSKKYNLNYQLLHCHKIVLNIRPVRKLEQADGNCVNPNSFIENFDYLNEREFNAPENKIFKKILHDLF